MIMPPGLPRLEGISSEGTRDESKEPAEIPPFGFQRENKAAVATHLPSTYALRQEAWWPPIYALRQEVKDRTSSRSEK